MSTELGIRAPRIAAGPIAERFGRRAFTSVAAATLPSATFGGNLARIAAMTDSSRMVPLIAAKPPSSGTLGTARPTCLSAISVAGTVHSRCRRNSRVYSPSPRSQNVRVELIRM